MIYSDVLIQRIEAVSIRHYITHSSHLIVTSDLISGSALICIQPIPWLHFSRRSISPLGIAAATICCNSLLEVARVSTAAAISNLIAEAVSVARALEITILILISITPFRTSVNPIIRLTIRSYVGIRLPDRKSSWRLRFAPRFAATILGQGAIYARQSPCEDSDFPDGFHKVLRFRAVSGTA